MERCGTNVSTKSLGLIYTSPSNINTIRSVVACIEIPKSASKQSSPSACIRFSFDSTKDRASSCIPYESIETSCTCSRRYKKTCPHREVFSNDSLLRSEVAFLLSLWIQVEDSQDTERKWDAFVMGNRRKSKNVSWIAAQGSDHSAVIESRCGKKAYQQLSRRLQCTKCARNSANRGQCIHESTVLSSAEELDELPDVVDEAMVGNQSARVSYLSTLPRRAIPCASNRKSTQHVCASLTRAQWQRTKRDVDKHGVGKVPEGTYPQDYTAFDILRQCSHCGILLLAYGDAQNCTLVPRIVTLHTLIYGSTYIVVSDFRCKNCERTTIYDGRDDGLFLISRKMVFARELIDYWLYAVAMLGHTFREAFEMSRKVSGSDSVLLARCGGGISFGMQARLCEQGFLGIPPMHGITT